jgi:hypothetical protein
MIGIRGARVVVVDDDETEALPIMQAFARNGVSTAFFNGRPRGLPKKENRLKGVRLAVLDMDVVGGGVGDANKVATLCKVVASILSPENGPYVAIAWTKHPELQRQFEEYMFRLNGFPKPILTVAIEKAKCKLKNGKFDMTCIAQRVGEALDEINPFMFLQAWEEKAFDAASDVTNALSDITDVEAPDYRQWRIQWRTSVLGLMRALAAAVAEQHLNASSCIAALCDGLNPLHADRMENNSTGLSEEFASQSESILAATADCGVERRGKMNAMLHLGFDNLPSSSAGGVFRFLLGHKPKWVPSASSLLDDLIQPMDTVERTEERKAEVLAAAVPILVEVSPVCDHAQRNIRVPRFVAGVIVPEAFVKKLKKAAGFAWHLGPVHLDQPFMPSGEYAFVLSARHLVTQNKKRTESLRSSARLRAQALGDLNAWLFHHASRPGMTFLHSR